MGKISRKPNVISKNLLYGYTEESHTSLDEFNKDNILCVQTDETQLVILTGLKTGQDKRPMICSLMHKNASVIHSRVLQRYSDATANLNHLIPLLFSLSQGSATSQHNPSFEFQVMFRSEKQLTDQ